MKPVSVVRKRLIYRFEATQQSVIRRQATLLHSIGVNRANFLKRFLSTKALSTEAEGSDASTSAEIADDAILHNLKQISLSNNDRPAVHSSFSKALEIWEKKRADNVSILCLAAAHSIVSTSKDSTYLEIDRDLALRFIKIAISGLKKIRFPQGLSLCSTLVFLDDKEAVESYQKSLLDNLCANWCIIKKPDDVICVLRFLNHFRLYTCARLNAHVDARIPSIVGNVQPSQAHVLLQFLPLRREHFDTFLSKLDMNALSKSAFDNLIQTCLAKKAFGCIQNFNAALLHRCKSLNTRENATEFLATLHSCVHYLHYTDKLLLHVSKSFIKTDCLFKAGINEKQKQEVYESASQNTLPSKMPCITSDLIDIDALKHLTVLLLRCHKTFSKEYGSAKVILVLAAYLEPVFRMHDQIVNDALKLTLIEAYYKAGMRCVHSMGSYLKSVLRRGKSLTCDQAIVVVMASFASMSSEEHAIGCQPELIDFIRPYVRFATRHQLIEILEIFSFVTVISVTFTDAVANRVYQLRDSFTLKESCNILYKLAQIKQHEHASFKALEIHVEKNIALVDSSDIYRLLQALVKIPLRLCTGVFEQLIIDKASWLAKKASAQEACHILCAISARPLHFKALISCYSTRIIEGLYDLPVGDLLQAFISFIKLQTVDKKLFDKILGLLMEKKYELDEAEVGELILACSKVFQKRAELYQDLSLRAIAYAPILSVATCCKIMTGFASTNSKNEELFVVIVNRLIELKEEITQSQTQTILGCFARLKVPASAYCHSILPGIAEHLVLLTLQETLDVLKIFTLSKVYNHLLIKLISHRLIYFKKAISPGMAVEIFECYASIKAESDELFKALIDIIIDDLDHIPFIYACRFFKEVLQYPKLKRHNSVMKVAKKLARDLKYPQNHVEASKYPELCNCVVGLLNSTSKN